MSLKIHKREGPLFVADQAQLQQLLSSRTKDKVILGPALVGYALRTPEKLIGMVQQTPRDARKVGPLSREKPPKLHLGVERETVAALIRAKIRPVFAVDALLRYGTRVKADDLLLLSVMTASNGTSASVLRFRKGELDEINDYVLSAVGSHTYEADVQALVDRLRLRYPNAQFHWCGPLKLPASQSMPQAPDSIWGQAAVQALSMTGRASVLQRHGLAALLVIAAAGGYAGALWVPYTEYRASAAELAADNARLKGEYVFASERLSLLRALQAFSRTREGNTRPLDQFATVVSVASEHEKLRIKEAKLNWPSLRTVSPGLAYDFELVVEVPRLEGTTALEQSVPLLKSLSASTGMGMRVATVDGMREVAANGDKTPASRIYRIQGDFRNGV